MYSKLKFQQKMTELRMPSFKVKHYGMARGQTIEI